MPPKERHQTTTACARCYQRKKKCDKQIPSCSRCLQAGKPCIGINRLKNIEVPRRFQTPPNAELHANMRASIVQFLEQELAKLDHQSRLSPVALAPDRNPGRSQHEITHHGGHNQKEHESILISIATNSVTSIHSVSLLFSQTGLYHRNRLFYGSEPPPLKVQTGINQEKPYKIRARFSKPKNPTGAPLIVPIEVAKLLLKVFIDHILPRYPCFTESELQQHFDIVYQNNLGQEGQHPPDSSRFIVSMVLAISALTSKSHDIGKVSSLSESLHHDALRHSQFLCQSNITTLRGFLLLIQFTLLLPHTSNLWYMTGEAMRMAISLGLHHERNPPTSFNLTDLRRRIFWTTYILERTLCIASGCPLGIREEDIDIGLPSEYEDACITPQGLDLSLPHRRKKTQFIDLVRFRHLLTEIHAIQFFGHQLPESAIDYIDWVSKSDQQIENWLQQALGHETAPDWFSNAVQATRLMLHRPCSRNPNPSDMSMLEAVKTAILMINGCWKLTQSGYLIYPLHNVYYAFHAGIVLLYSLKHRAGIYQLCDLYGKCLESLDLLARVFPAVAERWPAAMNTGYYFNELKNRVLQSIQLISSLDNSSGTVDLIAELDNLVTARATSGFYQNSTLTNINFASFTENSPDWLQMPPFPIEMDDSWQSFMNTGFGFDSPNALFNTIDFDEFNSMDLAVTVEETAAVLETEPEKLDHSIISTSLESVMESIPSCTFCRDRRIKCDRALPKCRQCGFAGKICVFYDTVLAKNIPGSYIHELHTNIKSKHGEVTATNLLSPSSKPGCEGNDSSAVGLHNIFIRRTSAIEILPLRQHLEHDQIPLNDDFFGKSSSLSTLNAAIMVRPCFRQVNDFSEYERNAFMQGTELTSGQYLQRQTALPSYSVSSVLVKAFAHSINVFYPTIAPHVLDQLLSAAYNTENSISGTLEEQNFYIILGVSSHLTRWNTPNLINTASAYFTKGTSALGDSVMHETTRTSQVLLLQRTLLICLYLLLDPGSGDLWRNLGFAVRLFFDMVHRPSDGEKEQDLAVMLYRTLYCLECQAAIAYGRPSLLAISDVLRDNMLINTNSTAAERISIQFYRISFLKFKILDEVLSVSDNFKTFNYQIHQQNLQSWYEAWKREAELFGSSLAQEAWAKLQYYESLLLLWKANLRNRPQPATLENQHTCQHIVEACTTFLRYPITSLLSSNDDVFFPLTWTTAHTVFSASLSLFSQPKTKVPLDLKVCKSRNSVMRRCLALMASLEANPNNLATGLTVVLESFISDDEQD